MIDLGLACIESRGSRGAFSFVAAELDCQRSGKRLCTFVEWYVGCTQFGSQLMDTTDNFEWVNAVYPDDGGIKALAVGEGSCEAATLDDFPRLHKFRCCQ